MRDSRDASEFSGLLVKKTSGARLLFPDWSIRLRMASMASFASAPSGERTGSVDVGGVCFFEDLEGSLTVQGAPIEMRGKAEIKDRSRVHPADEFPEGLLVKIRHGGKDDGPARRMIEERRLGCFRLKDLREGNRFLWRD
jgi:hypothetical protein